MNRDEIAYYLTLQKCPGLGPVTICQLLEANDHSVEKLFAQTAGALNALGFNQNQIEALRNPPTEIIDQTFDWLDSSDNHHLITLQSADYPDLLRQIKDPPPVLYGVGRMETLDTPQLAIVGSRNCTPGGARTAEEFASYLSRSGLTITSGMALGIDQHAHQGALQAGGNTIAVIGTGIDRIYPSRNKKLAYEIAERGLIVSEFPLGTPPLSENFPKRNRVISGLSVATLVVEATRKSGSLITAQRCVEQGREVFAIPGSIHNPQAKGCHHLIRQGAKLVDQASDIIDDIDSLLGYVAQQAEPSSTSQVSELDDEYLQLLEFMGYDPVSIDTLVERSGLTIEQLSSMLLILELNDHIQPAPGGLYIRR